MRRDLLRKDAIAVIGPAEQGTDVIAGMPAGPSVPRETLGIVKRSPKTLAFKTEGGVPTAIAEGAREMVDQLERKFGSDPFMAGFIYEIKLAAEKDAGVMDALKRFFGGGKPPSPPPVAPLQTMVRHRAESMKPTVPQKSGITREKLKAPAEQDIWSRFGSRAERLALRPSPG